MIASLYSRLAVLSRLEVGNARWGLWPCRGPPRDAVALAEARAARKPAWLSEAAARFRDGRVTEYKDFGDRQQAFPCLRSAS